MNCHCVGCFFPFHFSPCAYLGNFQTTSRGAALVQKLGKRAANTKRIKLFCLVSGVCFCFRLALELGVNIKQETDPSGLLSSEAYRAVLTCQMLTDLFLALAVLGLFCSCRSNARSKESTTKSKVLRKAQQTEPDSFEVKTTVDKAAFSINVSPAYGLSVSPAHHQQQQRPGRLPGVGERSRIYGLGDSHTIINSTSNSNGSSRGSEGENKSSNGNGRESVRSNASVSVPVRISLVTVRGARKSIEDEADTA